MARWREGDVHIAMREFFDDCGWQLIAGEYPGGSDHELYPLCVVDRELARDDSPAPRHHSLGEQIPDLVAAREHHLAIVEAKVDYSAADRRKLQGMLSERRADLLHSLAKFSEDRGVPLPCPPDDCTLHPVLAFAAPQDGEPAPGFTWLCFDLDREEVTVTGPLAPLLELPGA